MEIMKMQRSVKGFETMKARRLPSILGRSSSDWETEILRQWDNPKFHFPVIPSVDWGYARARLTAFRSQGEWLVVFELIGYDSEAGLCMNEVRAFGNKLGHNRRLLFETVVAPPKEAGELPFFDTDEQGNILLDPLDYVVEVRGKKRHFAPTPQDYARLGMNLQERTAGEIDALIKVLRLLTYTIPEDLFFSDAELLERLGRPRDLPRFLQLYDWYHPDWRRKEKPRDSPRLRSLARALASDDPDVYECPENLHNTHWSHWPEWPE